MTDDANADQRTYWTDAVGADWVALQEGLDQLLAPALEVALDAAGIRVGDRVLDIGCGTGALSRRAALAAGAGGQVAGVDISPTMLARAAEITVPVGAAPVTWLEADAESHGFAPASADVIVSRFGVMFFADSVRAFQNLRQAAAPGARLAFVCWSGPEDSPYFRLMGEARAAVAGPPPPGDPHAPGPMAFADRDRVLGLFRAAGWDASAHQVEVMLNAPGGIEGFVTQALRVGPIASALRSGDLDPADIPAAQAKLREVFAPMTAPDGSLSIPNRLNVFTASV